MKVIERPPQFCFSKNEIRYVFGYATQIYWKDHQQDGYDSNLFIKKSDGTFYVQEYANNQGIQALIPGETVTLILPIFDAWPDSNGIAHLLVKKGNDVVYDVSTNNPMPDGLPALQYTFVVESGITYSVCASARLNTNADTTPYVPAAENNPFIKLQLWYKTIGNDTPFLLKTFTRLPNTDGKTYVYLNNLIDSLLEYALPIFSDQQTDASSEMIAFYILWAEGTEDDLTPALSNSETTHIRYVIKGGIERKKYSRNNFFRNYFNTVKPFFTWQPDYKMVQMNEPVFITAFVADNTLTGRRLRIVITKFDGSTVTHDINSFAIDGKFLYHLNVSPTFLNLVTLASTTNIASYSVALQNISDGSNVIAPRTFMIDYRPAYTYYDLLWINSLGGVDTIRVRGDVTVGLNKDTAQVSAGLDLNDWNATQKKGDVAIQRNLRNDYYKGDIGYVEDDCAQDALKEILQSTQVFMHLDSRWVPVIGLQQSADLRTSSDKKYSFALEWQIAISEETYTPGNIALGIVTDDETYS